MLSNHHGAQDTQQQPTFLLHPHDPSVETEYETLIRAWKNQLIDTTPASPNTDYIRFAWIRLMDHYLDQQWLDSKQMLQCAQAWSARDQLSITEAVHTMNVLGLKSMQRSLDARQELLHTLGDPELMVGFGLQQQQQQEQRFSYMSPSLTGSEQDVHAPLLVKHNPTPIDDLSTMMQQEEAIITTSKEDRIDTIVTINDEEDVNINDMEPYDQEEEIKTRYVIEEEEEEEDNDDISPLGSRIYSQSSGSRINSRSNSSPNISMTSRTESISNARKYESYYQKLNHECPDDNNDSDSISISDSNSSGEVSSPNSGVQWKSWFLNSNNETTFAEEFAAEKVETDASFVFHPEYMTKQQQPYLMVRSESSISAFRPISNNLAPRCHQVVEELPGISSAPITKSKSFPSKASMSKPPQKSSNFMIRSIVSKKVSLSKLFSSKKSASSTSLSSSHH